MDKPADGLVRCFLYAGVAELADALDLGSSAARRGGSNPLVRTRESKTARRNVLPFFHEYLSVDILYQKIYGNELSGLSSRFSDSFHIIYIVR